MPTMPPAPGLFSTTTCGRPATWRSRNWATSRAKMSVGPPAEFGTTRTIVLPANSSAPAAGFRAARPAGEAAGAAGPHAARSTASRASRAITKDELRILRASEGQDSPAPTAATILLRADPSLPRILVTDATMSTAVLAVKDVEHRPEAVFGCEPRTHPRATIYLVRPPHRSVQRPF